MAHGRVEEEPRRSMSTSECMEHMMAMHVL